MTVPLIRPAPPRLSQAISRLREIEDSGMFSNYGPVNTAFEADLMRVMFAETGACTTVCNATIGLMLAINQATGAQAPHAPGPPRYALMPSFTFAAAAHAAMWCGLTPLFCDIDPGTWAACPKDEDRLLDQYGDRIAIVMPYATFGYDIDLRRYEDIRTRRKIPVVVDAAASLGTLSHDGHAFGTGFGGLVVYSMHVTKSFSAGEGGIIYSADPGAIAELRQMANFGFGRPRAATMPGLNAKLSEIGALLGQLRLGGHSLSLSNRASIVEGYRCALPDLTFQHATAMPQAHQFAPALLPRALAPRRAEILAGLTRRGIGVATYFSPHLLEQDYFRDNTAHRALPVTQDVASRIISLPVFDGMVQAELDEVCGAVRAEIAPLLRSARKSRTRVDRPALRPARLPANVGETSKPLRAQGGATSR